MALSVIVQVIVIHQREGEGEGTIIRKCIFIISLQCSETEIDA
jgi:hypothetical protein